MVRVFSSWRRLEGRQLKDGHVTPPKPKRLQSVWVMGAGWIALARPLNRSEVGLTTERMSTELDAGLVRVEA